jgi:hypothetical protein
MEDGRPHPRPGPTSAIDRTAHRHKTFEPTTLQLAAGEVRAHILNVSATGALIHAPGEPAKGARVTVRLVGRDIPAEVMWVDGARFGIAFRGMLSPDELARLLD